MQSSYKGYYLEEGKDGVVYVYDSVEAWRERRWVYIGDNEYLAKVWVDLLVGDTGVSAVEPPGPQPTPPEDSQPFAEAIRKLPFMPEPGPRVLSSVAEEIYGLKTFEAPVSEYGRIVVDKVSSALTDFIGTDFLVVKKFDETGWASDSVMYNGELRHLMTNTEWYMEISVSFEWRKPEDIETMYIEFLMVKLQDGTWANVPLEIIDSGEYGFGLNADEGRKASAKMIELREKVRSQDGRVE